jgi:SAM-dependent methyltransferase
MPRLIRTILPRIRKSLAERGVIGSISRSLLLPIHLLREHRMAKSLTANWKCSEFDSQHGVETEGERDGWTFLSDLNIASPNWIYGTNYIGTEPERFTEIFACLHLNFERFTFIDFGSGKGRVLLMASQFPFKSILGIEFSPELLAIAQRNIERYANPTQRCMRIESVCMDFVDFQFPPEPCVLYFYDPCEVKVLTKVVENLRLSLQELPRKVYAVCLAPKSGHFWGSIDFLSPIVRNEKHNFLIYEGSQVGARSTSSHRAKLVRKSADRT